MGKVFGYRELRAALPQCYPMLMLDRAEELSENSFVAVKNVSINEQYVQGHFPGHPIMPGVLAVEAMKQLAELAVRPRLDAEGKSDVYIRVLEKVKFRKPNNPGDRLKIEAEVESVDAAKKEAIVKAKTTNNSGQTCEAVFTLGVRPCGGPDRMPVLFNEFDKNAETPMDVLQIMSLVPHRYPFLLIDNLVKIDGDRVVATKNVSANEELFAHRDDGYAVMPEALLCEITAQSGCACVLQRPENKGKLGYFMSIDRAESFRPVYPGDQLVVDIVLPPGKSKFGKGTGIIRVDGEVVFEVTLMFAIVDP